MAVRALLFDFNGILVDDEPVHCELLREVLAAEGISLTVEAYYEDYLGFDDEGVLERAFAAAGRRLEPERLGRLVERKAVVYRERMAEDGYPFFPGALATLRWALDRYPVAIVSGALRAEIEGALEQAGVRDRVRGIVSAEDAASKPDPEGYVLGLSILRKAGRPGLDAGSVLAIEDSPAGIRAAVDAGLQVVGVAQTYPADRLRAAPRVIDRISDLQGLLEATDAPALL